MFAMSKWIGDQTLKNRSADTTEYKKYQAPKKELTAADKEVLAKAGREAEARQMMVQARANIYEERVKNGTANEFEKQMVQNGGLGNVNLKTISKTIGTMTEKNQNLSVGNLADIKDATLGNALKSVVDVFQNPDGSANPYVTSLSDASTPEAEKEFWNPGEGR